MRKLLAIVLFLASPAFAEVRENQNGLIVFTFKYSPEDVLHICRGLPGSYFGPAGTKRPLVDREASGRQRGVCIQADDAEACEAAITLDCAGKADRHGHCSMPEPQGSGGIHTSEQCHAAAVRKGLCPMREAPEIADLNRCMNFIDRGESSRLDRARNDGRTYDKSQADGDTDTSDEPGGVDTPGGGGGI